MKAILKFDLSDEDELHKFKMMFYATNLWAVLEDYKLKLRQFRKHGFPESIKTLDEAAEILSEQFYSLLSEYDLPSDL